MTTEDIDDVGWQELTPDMSLPDRVARVERILDTPVDRSDLIGLLVTDADLELRVQQLSDTAASDAPLEQMVGRTRIFIDRKRLTDLQWDSATFIGVMALAHSATFSAAATLFQKALRTVKFLSEAELDLTIVLAAASGGHPYDTPVSEDSIIAQYDGDRRRSLDLLRDLSKKGVVEKVGTGWRMVW